MSHDLVLPAAREALPAWGIGSGAALSPVPGGTLNWNFRVETGAGRWFLRCYRDDLERERIEGEHALTAWVAARGVRAPAPIAAGPGSTLVEEAGWRFALFPWADGAAVPRGELSERQAHSLGAAHGHMQAVLAGHPLSEGARMAARWDGEQSLAALTRLIARASERREPAWIVEGLRKQRRMLEDLEVLPPEAFAALPAQLLHGDFHDQQALFEGDEVSAIVDWEIWHADPRAWELIRSLAFSRLLGTSLMEAYLAGYREWIRPAPAECELALRLWWQSRVVSVWAWWACLVEGNERVRPFFPAMVEELDRVADAGWRSAMADRFVRAAAG